MTKNQNYLIFSSLHRTPEYYSHCVTQQKFTVLFFPFQLYLNFLFCRKHQLPQPANFPKACTSLNGKGFKSPQFCKSQFSVYFPFTVKVFSPPNIILIKDLSVKISVSNAINPAAEYLLSYIRWSVDALQRCRRKNPSTDFLNSFAAVWHWMLLISGHKNMAQLWKENTYNIPYNCSA